MSPLGIILIFVYIKPKRILANINFKVLSIVGSRGSGFRVEGSRVRFQGSGL